MIYAPLHLDDARCAIFLFQRHSRRPDVYSFLGFSEAAEQIQQECVGDPELRLGGYVDQIGMFGCVSLCQDVRLPFA